MNLQSPSYTGFLCYHTGHHMIQNHFQTWKTVFFSSENFSTNFMTVGTLNHIQIQTLCMLLVNRTHWCIRLIPVFNDKS